MKEQIIKSIMNNLENIDDHFLKCVLAYTNVLASGTDSDKGTREQ